MAIKMSLPGVETDREISEKLLKSETFQKAIKDGVRLHRSDSPDYYDFCAVVIREVYGKLGKENFNSISHAAPWFCHRQNLIASMLDEAWLESRKKEIFEEKKVEKSLKKMLKKIPNDIYKKFSYTQRKKNK